MRHRRLAFLLLGCFAAGLAHAQTETLGLNSSELFHRGMNALSGVGVSRSDFAALDYLHRSAELGHAPAQTVLGFLYDTGTVTTKDPAQALDWYKRAAQQDDALAEWLAGRLLYSGSVPPRDLNDASHWLEKSSAHDHPFGAYLLGMVFRERNDYAKAAVQFRKASTQGLPQAQQQLGLLLKQGRGVPENRFEAYVWLLLSSQAGNASAAAELPNLEADLGSNQVEQAKNRARDLMATTSRVVTAHGC